MWILIFLPGKQRMFPHSSSSSVRQRGGSNAYLHFQTTTHHRPHDKDDSCSLHGRCCPSTFLSVCFYSLTRDRSTPSQAGLLKLYIMKVATAQRSRVGHRKSFLFPFFSSSFLTFSFPYFFLSLLLSPFPSFFPASSFFLFFLSLPHYLPPSLFFLLPLFSSFPSLPFLIFPFSFFFFPFNRKAVLTYIEIAEYKQIQKNVGDQSSKHHKESHFSTFQTFNTFLHCKFQNYSMGDFQAS